MAIILYAITKQGFFCKKETLDKKIDNLDWMRISTDRKFFKELTTLHAMQPILVGSKTARVMPKLANRKTILISRCLSSGITLKQALQKYPEAILIGGASVIKSAMTFAHREHFNSIITVRLPISIPLDEMKNYVRDPLLTFKNSGILKRSSQFFMYTDNYEQPTILVEIWRPTWND